MHASWILTLGLVSLASIGACSSGSNDTVPDAGGDAATSSSSSSSGAGSSSGGSSSSSSSSGGGTDASNITVIFPFDSMTSGTDVGDWPGDSFCIGQTGLDAGTDAATSAGDDGGGEAGEAGDTTEAGSSGGMDAAAEAAPNLCGTEIYLQGASTVTYDPTVGDTLPGGDPGSLKIVIPFYGYNQQADFQHIFTMPLQTLAGQTLFVRVRLDSGFVSNVSAQGGFVLDVKSGAGFVYAQSAYTFIE